MTLGPPTRLTCPHCGKSKYILSIASGNTFGATHWSDTKHDYPMLRHPSSVQRCPHCDGYFFYEDSKPVDCNPDALSEKHSLTDWDAEWSGDAGNATISEKKDRKRYWERWEKANANGFGDLTFGETDAAFDGLYASAYLLKCIFRRKYNNSNQEIIVLCKLIVLISTEKRGGVAITKGNTSICLGSSSWLGMFRNMAFRWSSAFDT